MRRRVQISFLSVFLTLLTVAFAAALVVRVRSYTIRTATDSTAVQTASAGSPTARGAFSATHAGDEPLPVAGNTPGSITTTSRVTTSSPATTRAQRFRELLALGPPKAATTTTVAPVPVPVQVKPTPLPAVKSPPASSKPMKASPVAQISRPNAGGSGQQASQSGSGKSANGPTDPHDPNSDTAPPQLISVNFDPPQVQDGGDTTLIITATDDLSGVRGISGTLMSPNGKAVQGFAQQRDGETMRYLSRIHMPEKAEEGIWKISFLTMSDMASNSVTLSASQGSLPPTAVLKVISSASDSTAPTLRNVWLDRRTMRPGEHNTLFVDAQDDKSGVHIVAAVFLSPAGKARIGVGCQKGSGDVWQCDVFPPVCLDCGDWTLEQIQLQDNASNFANVRNENALVAGIRLNISGDSCDNTPPVLQSLSLNRTQILMGRDEPVVEVTAQVSDDSCGIGGVSAQVVGPGSASSGMFFSFTLRDANTYVGTIRLDPHAARGVWRIQSVTVNDVGQNLKTYSGNDPLLARATFTVK